MLTGTCLRRTIWKRGPTPERSTARPRSCSRSIKPLYQGRSAHEVLALLSESRGASGQDLVKQHWRDVWTEDDSDEAFDRRWQIALHDGVIEGSTSGDKSVQMTDDWEKHLNAIESKHRPTADSNNLELVVLPDPTLLDGRFANNSWLQELPKPVTLLTWGNAAIVSPATAERLGLKRGTYVHGGQHGGHSMPVVELTVGDRRVRGPLWIMPGHADETVTVYLGNGRLDAGRVGNGVGFNAFRLRTLDQPWFAAASKLTDLGETETVACTQVHHSMEGRDVVRAATLAEYRENPSLLPRRSHHANGGKSPRVDNPLTFYDGFAYEPPKHKWGMAIDLTSCVGCNACVVACQAENNIPVVGKEQVAFGREMHWLRVDRYSGGHGRVSPGDSFPTDPLHALRKRAVRVCLSRRGDGAQRRGAERHDLQPLRRHAVLLEQLSLQSAPIQFPGLCRLRCRSRTAAVQPRRHRAISGCDGKVHLLRPEDSAGRDRRPNRTSRLAGRRHSHGLPGGLPGAGDRLWRHERSGK